ncbi:hypothetical protein L1987_65916 [Smallanthus sonchifolius]|uniref:Uncharacterized protein n=1 Tax=Smallanthus sonchifolius TaxID=185202 RepID=A0ACB9BVV0_9ASTR|nr:hypothetical protein L1987_65916 [Smallanthus sonchifolius]
MDSNGRQWQEVKRRKRFSIKRNWIEKIRATTFFVTNLPMECSNSMLKKSCHSYCKDYGIIRDAYVAKRKDSSGSFFGFVRFSDIRDTNGLLDRLGEVKIGRLKISAKLARFNRFGDKIEVDNQRVGYRHGVHEVQRSANSTWPTIDINKGDRRSFKDVVSGKPGIKPDNTKVIQMSDKGGWWAEFIKNRAVLVKAVSVAALINISKIMKEDGIYDITVMYVGGLYSMISFKSHKVANDFIKNKDLEVKKLIDEATIWKEDPDAWSPIINKDDEHDVSEESSDGDSQNDFADELIHGQDMEDASENWPEKNQAGEPEQAPSRVHEWSYGEDNMRVNAEAVNQVPMVGPVLQEVNSKGGDNLNLNNEERVKSKGPTHVIETVLTNGPHDEDHVNGTFPKENVGLGLGKNNCHPQFGKAIPDLNAPCNSKSGNASMSSHADRGINGLVAVSSTTTTDDGIQSTSQGISRVNVEVAKTVIVGELLGFEMIRNKVIAAGNKAVSQ